jgi:hypothetical protein
MGSTFTIVWVTLLLAPVAATLVFAAVPQSRIRTRIAAASAILLVVVASAALTGFVFTMPLANAVAVAAAYAAYCFLAVSVWRIPQIFVRVVALIGAFLPIACGYMLSTVGMLGLAFIVGDFSAKPEQTEQMTNGLVCHVTLWGMAASASGYTVSLNKSWSLVPFIEKRVVTIPVTQSGYIGEQPKDASCADALAKYRQ